MSADTSTLIEWAASLLSLLGFWLCIRHRASCFLVFLVADVGWFISAWQTNHVSLIFQQSVYILLNIVGYQMWKKDEKLQQALDALEQRGLHVEELDRAKSHHESR